MTVIGGGIVLLFAVDIAFRYWKLLRSIKHLPGRRAIFGLSLGHQVLPTIPGISISRHESIDEGHNPYAKHGRDIISWVGMIPTLKCHIYVADALAVKEVSRLPKNLEVYTTLQYFGSNLFAANGDEWRRQRKIVAPSFNEKNNKLIWNESIRLSFEIFDVWGKDSATAFVNDSVSELTLPLALAIISSAGFGQPSSWYTSTEPEIPRGHTLSFKTALQKASSNLIPLAYLPRWVIRMSKKLREGDEAANELKAYLREMIEDQKNGVGMEERNDLFSAMVAANMSSEKDSPNEQLSESELLGNMFIFIVAGHETTAHTISFILGLLAIEQEEQEKLRQHILSVSPGQSVPTYESFGQLFYVQAVINETMRLYPPVIEIPRKTETDMTLPTHGPGSEIEHIFIPGNTEIRLNTVGLHYNPRYWRDPHKFDPSRFVGEYNHDAFIPFSTGSRACIGRRFSETEIRVEFIDNADVQR